MNKFAVGYGYAPQAAYTIAEFCDAHGISRTHLHNLDKSGKGPRKMRCGRRVLISTEAAAEWRRQLEQAAEGREVSA
jgi:hypothetical protein